MTLAQTLHSPLSKKIGKRMWREAGMPERVAGDPTSAYLGWYEDRAAEVLDAVARAGLVVKRAKASKAPARKKATGVPA